MDKMLPMDQIQSAGHGSAAQMARAYSAIVRSLENLPELATFATTLLVHCPGAA